MTEGPFNRNHGFYVYAISNRQVRNYVGMSSAIGFAIGPSFRELRYDLHECF